MLKKCSISLFFVVIMLSIYCRISFAQETVILTETSPNLTITSDSVIQVYGTQTSNHLTIERGAVVKLINFPGNNIIDISSKSNLFSVSRAGAYVSFEGSDGTLISMAATKTIQKINFEDNISFDLVIADNQVVLANNNFEINIDNNPTTLFSIRLIAPDILSPIIPRMQVSIQPTIQYAGNHEVRVSIVDAPEGMSIVSRSGRLMWTPGDEFAGTVVPIQISATDGTVYDTLSFTVTVAGLEPVATTWTEEVNGGTRITVTEDIGNLQGMDIILPEGVISSNERMNHRQVKASDNNTGISLITIDSVDPNSIPSDVTPLTDFFQIAPATVDGDGWIEVIFPEFELPDGRYPDELFLFVFDQPMGVDGPIWIPVAHGLEYIDNQRVRILIAKTGYVSFIGIRNLENGYSRTSNRSNTSSTTENITLIDGTEVVISCEKKSTNQGVNNKIDICSANISIDGTSKDFKFQIEGLHDNSNNLVPNWTPNAPSAHTLSGWLLNAILKFEKFGLDYDSNVSSPNINVLIESIEWKKDNNSYSCPYGYVTSADKRRTLHLASRIGQNCSNAFTVDEIKVTSAHEYLHHAQAKTGNILDDSGRIWAYEGTAVWFEDEVYDPINDYLEFRGNISPKYLDNGVVTDNTDKCYDRFPFFKFLQQSSSDDGSDQVGCDFETFLPKFFKNHTSSATGAQRLIDVLADDSCNCNFGDVFGENGESLISNALEYYTWATQIENDRTQIDHNEPQRFTFEKANRQISVIEGPSDNFQELTLPPLSAIVYKISDNALLPGLDSRILRQSVESGNRVLFSIRDDDGDFRYSLNSDTHIEYVFPTGSWSTSINGWYVTLVNDDPVRSSKIQFQLVKTGTLLDSANVTITEPLDGEIFNERVIRIEGAAEGTDVDSVRVNIQEMGYSITLPVFNDTFEGMITIAKGTNTISVTPRNSDGTDIWIEGNYPMIKVTGEINPDENARNALIESQMVFTLTWDQPRDMDIHVMDPLGNWIYYNNLSASVNGTTYGRLDYDNIPGFGEGADNSPEVITYFSDMNTLADMEGCYEIKLHYYSSSGSETNLTLDMLLNENNPEEIRAYRESVVLSVPRSNSDSIFVHCRSNGVGSHMICEKVSNDSDICEPNPNFLNQNSRTMYEYDSDLPSKY